jgi:hypothetical protein
MPKLLINCIAWLSMLLPILGHAACVCQDNKTCDSKLGWCYIDGGWGNDDCAVGKDTNAQNELTGIDGKVRSSDQIDAWVSCKYFKTKEDHFALNKIRPALVDINTNRIVGDRYVAKKRHNVGVIIDRTGDIATYAKFTELHQAGENFTVNKGGETYHGFFQRNHHNKNHIGFDMSLIRTHKKTGGNFIQLNPNEVAPSEKLWIVTSDSRGYINRILATVQSEIDDSNRVILEIQKPTLFSELEGRPIFNSDNQLVGFIDERKTRLNLKLTSGEIIRFNNIFGASLISKEVATAYAQKNFIAPPITGIDNLTTYHGYGKIEKIEKYSPIWSQCVYPDDVISEFNYWTKIISVNALNHSIENKHDGEMIKLKIFALTNGQYSNEQTLWIHLDDKYENLSDDIKVERERDCAQTCRNNQFYGREKCYD